jgi:hypothetical protein
MLPYIRQRSGNRQSVHGRRSALFEHLRAFAEGRAGGEYIVHKENPPAFQFMRPGHMECAPDILQPLTAVQTRLGLGPVFSKEKVILHGKFQSAGQSLRQEPGLIEPPLAKAVDMKRNGQHQIDPGKAFLLQRLKEEHHEGRNPVQLSAELQLVNAASNDTGMLDRRPRRIE